MDTPGDAVNHGRTTTAARFLRGLHAGDDAAAQSALDVGQVFDAPDDAQSFVMTLGRLLLDLARQRFQDDDEQVRRYLHDLGSTEQG